MTKNGGKVAASILLGSRVLLETRHFVHLDCPIKGQFQRLQNKLWGPNRIELGVLSIAYGTVYFTKYVGLSD